MNHVCNSAIAVPILPALKYRRLVHRLVQGLLVVIAPALLGGVDYNIAVLDRVLYRACHAIPRFLEGADHFFWHVDIKAVLKRLLHLVVYRVFCDADELDFLIHGQRGSKAPTYVSVAVYEHSNQNQSLIAEMSKLQIVSMH